MIQSLKYEIDRIKNKGWIVCNHKNRGCAGLKLEELLNINPDNFEIPDYYGIEIKTKKSIRNNRVTLFSAAPDSYIFEIKRIYELYSYPEKNGSGFKVLNTNLNSTHKVRVGKNYYFQLNIDRQKQIVELLVFNKYKIVDRQTSWSFELLKEKVERKLKYLCFVDVDTRYYNSNLFVKYTNDNYYKLKNFDTFIYLLEKGIITISIRLGVFKSGKKEGQIHDHGTGFCIDKTNLEMLFENINP